MGCNYLSLPLIPASGTQVLTCGEAIQWYSCSPMLPCHTFSYKENTHDNKNPKWPKSYSHKKSAHIYIYTYIYIYINLIINKHVHKWICLFEMTPSKYIWIEEALVVISWEILETSIIEMCFKITYRQMLLTHWGRVMHICVSNLTIIGSDNSLSPDQHQAIIWTYAGILFIGPLGSICSEIIIEINTFSLKKNVFENVVWKIAAILSRPQCVETWCNMWYCIQYWASI